MKSKIVAALLAIFLGGIGIHKFYLGENATGLIYLLFCWTFIPALLALIDFLGLLLMSDQAFDAKYNQAFPSVASSSSIQESSKDKAAALGELKKLYDSEIITAEEYEAKRRKILDSI